MATKSQALQNLKEYYTVDLASEKQRVVEYHSDDASELVSRDTVFSGEPALQCVLLA